MKFGSVYFGFTKSLPNYQNAKAGATILLGKEDDPAEMMALAAAFVKQTLDLKLDPSEVELLALYDDGELSTDSLPFLAPDEGQL